MLFLLFHLGEDFYVLEASRISEVLPLVRIRAMPDAARAGIGVINHRGKPVPVIDLSELLLDRPAQRQLSTRIVLIRDEIAGGQPRSIGLVLEQATETLRLDPAEFISPGIMGSGLSYLGPVLADRRGLIHWIDPGKLFSHVLGTARMPEVTGQE